MSDKAGLERRGTLWVGHFRAMASPCEIHLDGCSQAQAEQLVSLARHEALRIECLLSRYRDDNIVHRINTAQGQAVKVDAETAQMLDFADTCFRLSEGRFDISSGVLRNAWHFDGSHRLPDSQDIEALLGCIGWQRARWQRPWLELPPGMQIDLGGIGKEYAVDRVLGLLAPRSPGACLVNFGGDLHASGPPTQAGVWHVGIESCTDAAEQGSGGSPTERNGSVRTLELSCGALATSGDARRYLRHEGVRYSHILDPRTGWPVPDAPASVTVAADLCVEAGMLATLAMLHGADAESFLAEYTSASWVQRR